MGMQVAGSPGPKTMPQVDKLQRETTRLLNDLGSIGKPMNNSIHLILVQRLPQLVLKLGTLLRSPQGDAGPLLLELLQQQGQPTVLSLLRQARFCRPEIR